MKRILFAILFVVFTATVAVRAQDSGTQQQIDKLFGMIQDVQAAQELQTKKISVLEKDLTELRDKVNTPAANPDSASAADLKNLAEKVREIDKKRAADRELILDQIKQLGKVAGGSTVPVKPVKNKVAPLPDDKGTSPASPQKGYEHIVEKGETLPAIAKAYREQGVHVTTTQILKANPGMDANKILVGQKIFIPDPNAK